MFTGNQGMGVSRAVHAGFVGNTDEALSALKTPRSRPAPALPSGRR